MKKVFITPSEQALAIAAVKSGVPKQFTAGREKTLGERTKGLSSFFAASNVCADEGCGSLEVHPRNPHNHRDKIAKSFFRLFCDSPDGTKGMIELGEISADSHGRSNKERFSCDVLNRSWLLQGNITKCYPRTPLWLLQIRQTEGGRKPPSRQVIPHENWQTNLAKYLDSDAAWRGLVVFMLRKEPFEVSEKVGKIGSAQIREKLSKIFTKDVADFLIASAKLPNS